MTIINTNPDRIIQLGYEGEDRVTVLRFRYSADWLENGEGIFHIRVRRHGENHAYNAELLTADLTHMELLMTVTNTELSIKGAGEMQVVYSGENFVRKSPIYSYNVSRAVDEAVDPPAQDVYTEIIESLSDLQTDVRKIESDTADLSELTMAKIGDLTELTTEAKSSLVSAINEVNSKSVDDVLSATSTNPVQNKVLTARINSLDSDVGTLRTSVQSKADIQTVSALADEITDLNSDVQGLQTIVQGKADTQTVTALSDAVSGLQTAMQGKADVQTVTALSGTVSSLSDTTQQYMEYTNSAITDLQANKASKSYVDGELATKANVRTVTALSGTVTDLQANKADKTYVDTELAGKASTAVATTSSDGLMSAQDKSKLDEVGLLKEQIYNSYPNVEAETASVVSITDGADGIPVKSLVVGIEPVQDLHGYGSPWPAGGGKNLFYRDTDKTNTLNGITGTFDAETQTISVVGTNTSSSAYVLFNLECTGDIPKEVALARTLFNAPSGVYINLVYRKNGVWFAVNNGGSIPAEIDTTINLQIGVYGSATSINATNIKAQIELGSTATSYAPYENICPISGWTGAEVTVNEDVLDITFPSEAGTVYGGTLDVTNGVLTVDRAMVDLGTFTYTRMELPAPVTGRGYVFRASNFNMKANSTKCVCSEYPYLGSYIPLGTHDKAVGYIYAKNICVRDDDYTDATDFATAMSGVQLVYELETPITYTLTPQEAETLLGVNNIWADTGDTSLAYRADTKLYVDGICADCNSMLAPVESTYTATRNYTTGQLLIVDNTLYKVTANIANGGTITAGTNVVATTLSEVIASLS